MLAADSVQHKHDNIACIANRDERTVSEVRWRQEQEQREGKDLQGQQQLQEPVLLERR